MDADRPADRPSDAASTDASSPATPTDTPGTTTWPLLDPSKTTPTDTPTTATSPLREEAAVPPEATESRWDRWGGMAVGAVVVVMAFLIVFLDSLPVVGDWLTVHVPFWDEFTDFFDWLSSWISG
jgi:hypothetical protein